MIDVEKKLKEKFSNIRFEINQRDDFKIIYLTGFIVPIKLRNTGIGTDFMNELCKIADEIGYKITLTPSSAYYGNVNRLKDFYQRFGFVFNKGKNRDFSHRETMYRDPKTSGLDEAETTTTSTSSTNSPAPERTKRGKANPTSNTGAYEFGTQRGKANPIANASKYEFGTQRGPANPISENQTSGKTLISVDIQPEYKNYINFNLQNWVNTINQHDGTLIFLYNGYDTLGMIDEGGYKEWLFDLGVEEDIVYDKAIFYDKGYAFFRYCMDNDIEDDDIVGLVKMMIEYNINDSRELDKEFWDEFIERHGYEHVRELIEFSDDCINIPDLMDFLTRYSNILLCGGGQNECLKEVEIALMALDKPYDRLESFIYEKNNHLNEAIINIKKWFGILN
jgi:hypothetical protein